MVTKDTYRDLLMVVNYKATLETLQKYALERIEHHRQQLENATDIEKVREHQGAIKELRRFATLREEVTQGVK